MKNLTIKPIKRIKGIIYLPADKSISHRALMLGAIARGTTIIENLSFGEDCLRTIDVFQKMGVKMKCFPSSASWQRVVVFGKGLSLKCPEKSLYLGESGTTMRLLLGILAGQNFRCTLTGGKSLSKRPMLRVIKPLRMMGASISSRVKTQGSMVEEYPPITIKGGNLKAISYRLPIPSAQVKSAILLAGIYAQGVTSVIESVRSRDHTEKILKLFGVNLKIEKLRCSLKGEAVLHSPGRIKIPGDISSAAFFLVAAALSPGSYLLIKSVGLNPTRTGVIDVLRKMGADIRVKVQSLKVEGYEPVGDILIKGSKSRLKGVIIEKEQMPRLIDELPVLMVAASLAKGKTVITQTGELRLKETDRISSMSTNLRKMGADIKIKPSRLTRDRGETIIIQGEKNLNGARVNSFGDHRTAMSMIIAALFAKGQTVVEDTTCINKSFPEFMKILRGIVN